MPEPTPPDPSQDVSRLLTQECVLLKVSIGFWRGNAKLTADDLGLADEAVNTELISLGHKKLAPKEALAVFTAIEGKLNDFVEKMSFPFLNLARAVPNARIRETREGILAIQTEFWAAVDVFCDTTYPQNLEAWIQRWEAEVATLFPDDATKRAAALESVRCAFPTAENIRKKFGFDTIIFQIAVPEEIRAVVTDVANADAITVERARVAREAAAQIGAGVNAFVGDLTASLRAETAKLCAEMLDSIQKSKNGVRQPTLNRLAQFIDTYRTNWRSVTNDAELDQMLTDAQSQLLSTPAEQYRNDDTARAGLMAGLARIREAATKLAAAEPTLGAKFAVLGERKFAA